MSTTMTDLFGEVIHAYTRADALRDGVLVDVTDAPGGSREAGLLWPVAMTAAAHAATVAWGVNVDPAKPFTGNDETGRLWDVTMTLRMRVLPRACRIAQQHGQARVPFEVLCIPPQGRSVASVPTGLVLHLGPGDDGEPVITVMLPDED